MKYELTQVWVGFHGTSIIVGYLMPNLLHTYSLNIWFGLVGFYGIAIIVGYLMPNSLYTYILNIFDSVCLGWFLWHINNCWLSNAKSCLYIYVGVLMLINEKTTLTIVLQKNKEIYFFVGRWNIDVYTAICVSSRDRKGLFWSSVDRIFIQLEIVAWHRCLKIKRTGHHWENSTYHSGLVWVKELYCLENGVFL